MKIFKIHSDHAGAVLFAGLLMWWWFLLSGCQNPVSVSSDVSGVRISPLTEFVSDSGRADGVKVKAVIEVFGPDGVSCENGCVFRFEMYVFEPLSSDPRGKRLQIWPDFDLSSASEYKRYWKEYLKGYEFELPLDFTPQADHKYVLEVTCVRGAFRLGSVKSVEYHP